MMTLGGIGSLFFYDQWQRPRVKRSRVPPELLPFQLRELKSFISSKTKLDTSNRLRGKDVDPSSSLPENPRESEDSIEEERLLQTFSSTQVFEKRIKKSIDPEQKLKFDKKQGYYGVKVIRETPDEEGEDEEDSQKFLFEEAKFSAPNILLQLAKLFDRIIEEREAEDKQARDFYDEINAKYGDNCFKDGFKPSRIVIVLPCDLIHSLSLTFEQLVKGTIYTKRMWQTSSYRDATNSEKTLGNPDSFLTTNTSGAPISWGKKSDRMDVEIRSGIMSAQEKNGKTSLSDSFGNCALLHGTDSRDSGRSSDFEPPPIIAYRRESKTHLGSHPKPKTRAEKFKFYHMKEKQDLLKANAKLQIQRIGPMQDILFEDTKEYKQTKEAKETKDTREILEIQESGEFREIKEIKPKETVCAGYFTGTYTINFTMSSQQCLENGWIKMQTEEEDPERQTLIEWARGRLQWAIKKKEEDAENARIRNENGPLIFHYYGDNKREITMKYKKGVPAKTQLIEDNRKLFLTLLPDYGGHCFYPSGRPAVTRVRKGTQRPELYTFVYSDNVPSQMLACFTPSGKCACYYKSGSLRFVSTEKSAVFHDEEGNISKRWKWSQGKLQTTAILQLNEAVTLRCVSVFNMTLFVKIQGECTKFDVSGSPDSTDTLQENSKFLTKDMFYRESRRSHHKRDHKKQNPKAELSEVLIEERKKDLLEKFPERKNYELDNPEYRELYRLKNCVKTLVQEWLEHYRTTTGMVSSPRAGHDVSRRDKTHSASSLPSNMPSSLSMLQHDVDRIPSAPADRKSVGHRSPDEKDPDRPHSSGSCYSITSTKRKTERKSVRIELPSPTRPHYVIGASEFEISPVKAISSSTSCFPVRYGLTHRTKPLTLPKEGCPFALRMELLGQSAPQCRCDRRTIPHVTDVEYEAFVQLHVPKTQLLVVLISSSRHPKTKLYEEMLDALYYEKNKDRSFPCVQSRNDPFRLVRYDISTACEDGTISMLQRRHNAVPGMCLMYTGGKLIFADYIFNGYGNAKKDFLKQVTKSRKDGLQGLCLPVDFKFYPRPSRCGKRTPWGGQIGTPLVVTPSICGHFNQTPLMFTELEDSFHSLERSSQAPTSFDFVSAGLSKGLSKVQRYSLTPRS